MGGEQIAPITVARNLKERACEVFPTPLREHFGRSPFALDHVLERSDAPRKEVRLVKRGSRRGGWGQGG